MSENIFKIKADVASLNDGITPVIEAMEGAGFPGKICYKVHLALDELLTNVVSYAYEGKDGDVEIRYEITEEPKGISITIVDSGSPFNPLESEDPDLDVGVAERQIGGLGLFIVKSVMDEIEYKRENDQNVLTIRKAI